METNLNYKDNIVEFLIQNQDTFKQEVNKLKERKLYHLSKEPSIFRMDLEDQYNSRIKQQIAFMTADALAIPVEYVIIILEGIDLEEFLNV